MKHDLQELYQEIILEHNRNPHNKRNCPGCKNCMDGYNPSCGDMVNVCITLKGDFIEDICFRGEGCAISQASASLMTDLLTGKNISEAIKIIENVCHLLIEGSGDLSTYGDVQALSGVRKFPMRIKCATLAWHAAESILRGDSIVS